MIYYVSVAGSDRNPGTQDAPFRTINHAAQLAVAGDTVRVFGGEYREWVSPRNSGRSYNQCITYEAVAGEKPVIKGSELVKNWERVSGGVWKASIDNAVFGDFNPFATPVFGDWLLMPAEFDVHLGDVYLNGMSMFEAQSMEALYEAKRRTEGFHYPYGKQELIAWPENTVYQWYAQVQEDATVLWCNFQGYDPNRETVEINVRQSCFFPRQNGVNYITVRGFEMAHAATQYAPPTAAQTGMIGPNWSKGWVIENNCFHDAKCAAVSLGKEISTGDNFHTRFLRKSGYQNQQEAVFKALHAGWSKEKIGSHIVRNNEIYNCGQNGIVGHMGCIFSRIEGNYIHHIAKKQEFWGDEVAGIKLHAPIDVQIVGNHIHDCSLGTWMDWQTQGTRISGNLYHHNDRDLMIEVTHGPCVVDNNLLMSEFSLEYAAQGTAFVHNLIRGYAKHIKVLDRATPYHFPHSTAVAGFAFVYGGDDRFYHNIFLAADPLPSEEYTYFGSACDKHTTPQQYMDTLRQWGTRNDCAKYFNVLQPMVFSGNVYGPLAAPFRAEEDGLCAAVTASVEMGADGWELTLDVPASVAQKQCGGVTTDMLGSPRITECPFENPDGTELDLSRDFFGQPRQGCPGPIGLKPGKQSLKIWKN